MSTSQNISVTGHHLTSVFVPLTVILSDVRDRVITVSQAKVFFSLVIVFISSLFLIIPNYTIRRGYCQEESELLSNKSSTLLRHALNSVNPRSVIRVPLSMQYSVYMSLYSCSFIGRAGVGSVISIDPLIFLSTLLTQHLQCCSLNLPREVTHWGHVPSGHLQCFFVCHSLVLYVLSTIYKLNITGCQGIVKSFLQYFSDKCKINVDTWETLIPSAQHLTTFILAFFIFG